MKLIPKVNGKAAWREEKCNVVLPIKYQGECCFADQFGLEKADQDGAVLVFEEAPALSKESYVLDIRPDMIYIKSKTEAGKYYAMQTLSALLKDEQGVLNCRTIEDGPRYGYRGFMIDVSRHFFPVKEIKKIINQCAKYKMNKFHWHLSDDQGFRIESKKFPELNQKGSVRKEDDGTVYGGFYTQEEIKDIVAYASARQIEVIPEIDMPGHTSDMIAAYPELSCSGKETVVKTKGGVYEQILCAGNEKTMQFIYELLDEIVPLFPGKYFHIGGDEAPKAEWKKCKKCQELILREGLDGEEELQAYFTMKIADYLAEKGKTAIGWNEILASGKVKNMIAQYWTENESEYACEAAKKGQKFIFSNSNVFYMDYPYSMVTLKGTYMFEPNIRGYTKMSKDQILGLEAPVWTEYIEDEGKLEGQMFPRILALAENAWSGEKDYEDFLRRAELQDEALLAAGVESIPVKEADLCGEKGIREILAWTENWMEQMRTGKVVVPRENFEGAAVSGKQLILDCMQYSYTQEEREQAVRMFEELSKIQMQKGFAE